MVFATFLFQVFLQIAFLLSPSMLFLSLKAVSACGRVIVGIFLLHTLPSNTALYIRVYIRTSIYKRNSTNYLVAWKSILFFVHYTDSIGRKVWVGEGKIVMRNTGLFGISYDAVSLSPLLRISSFHCFRCSNGHKDGVIVVVVLVVHHDIDH